MKTTIQIIDDNVALTTLLAKTLAKFDFLPVVENNPLLAINTARHYLPDLILLDVMMPERDGGRVLADLRADLSLRYIPSSCSLVSPAKLRPLRKPVVLKASFSRSRSSSRNFSIRSSQSSPPP